MPTSDGDRTTSTPTTTTEAPGRPAIYVGACGARRDQPRPSPSHWQREWMDRAEWVADALRRAVQAERSRREKHDA